MNMTFCKSDNANCYHSIFAADGLYHLCKQHGIQLLRNDYNEPSKGKDQCDKESATAEALFIWMLVMNLHMLMTYMVVFTILQVLQTQKVAVIDIDKKIRKVVNTQRDTIYYLVSFFQI